MLPTHLPWTSAYNFEPTQICFLDPDWVLARKQKTFTKERRFFEDTLSQLCFEHKLSSLDPMSTNNFFLKEFSAKNNYKQKELYAGGVKWNFETPTGHKQCLIHESIFIDKINSVTLDHTFTQSMVLTSIANRIFREPISFFEFKDIFSDKPKRVALVPTLFNNQVRKIQDKFKDKFFEISENDIYQETGELVVNIYDESQFKKLTKKLSSLGIRPQESIENFIYNLGLKSGNFSNIGKKKKQEVISYIIEKILEKED